MNGTLQNWYSKLHYTEETSTYGSELVEARVVVEIIMEYRYKLRMLGVPILGMSVIYGGNMAVMTNALIPNIDIKKKYDACAYHFTRETGAAGIVYFTSQTNSIRQFIFYLLFTAFYLVHTI